MTDTILRQATQTEIDELNAGRTFAGQTRTTGFGTDINEKTYLVGFDGTHRMPTIQLSLAITTALANPLGSTITQGSGGITVATETVADGAGTTGAINAFVSQNLDACIMVVGSLVLDFVNENGNPQSTNERFWRIAA